MNQLNNFNNNLNNLTSTFSFNNHFDEKMEEKVEENSLKEELINTIKNPYSKDNSNIFNETYFQQIPKEFQFTKSLDIKAPFTRVFYTCRSFTNNSIYYIIDKSLTKCNCNSYKFCNEKIKTCKHIKHIKYIKKNINIYNLTTIEYYSKDNKSYFLFYGSVYKSKYVINNNFTYIDGIIVEYNTFEKDMKYKLQITKDVFEMEF
jgi:hypothetical protein